MRLLLMCNYEQGYGMPNAKYRFQTVGNGEVYQIWDWNNSMNIENEKYMVQLQSPQHLHIFVWLIEQNCG